MAFGILLAACLFLTFDQGDGAICNVQNEAEVSVLHVCSAGKRNGTRVVYLDNSQVPRNQLLDCFCSATVESDDYTYLLTLDVRNNYDCQIQFFVGSTRYCGSTNVTVGEQLGEIKFEKSMLSNSTACLRLETVLRDKDPDITLKYNEGFMTVECFENTNGRTPIYPDEPRTAIAHDDQHGTSRPPTRLPDVVHEPASGSNNSSGGDWSQCPACTCPACNCPACNCPPCNCSPDSHRSQQVINENFTEGHSSAVLIGCSIGLFVAGCIIGILVTLGISYFRRKTFDVAAKV